MKTFTRVLALILATLTLLAVVVACDQAGSGDEGGSVENSAYDINGRLNDNLPDDLNYKGEKVNVMYWSDVENLEFEVESVTGNNVSDAIFDRNNRIEDRLNVELVWNGVPGNANNRTGFVRQVQAYADAGQGSADIIATYSRTAGTLAVQGLLIDLATIKDSYVDLDMPWWPSQMVDTVSFGNAQGTSYYFLTGDISTNTMQMIHLLYFNKGMVESYGLENPYQLVYEGKWTMDKMVAMTSDCYKDLDRDGTVSYADQYGFVGFDYVAASFVSSCNLRCISKGTASQDTLVLSPDFGSAKMARLLSKLGDWAAQDGVRIHNGSVESIDTRSQLSTAFKSGRALMMIGFVVNARGFSQSQNLELGLLPTPKYDESQVNYYSGMGNPYSLYGIFVDFDERGNKKETLSKFTAVLECWASEGYRLTTPQVYESIFGTKYAAGQSDDTNMFEYVRAGVIFDLGQVFAAYLSTINERPAKAFCENVTWLEVYPYLEYTIGKQLEELCNSFRTYQAQRDQGR